MATGTEIKPEEEPDSLPRQLHCLVTGGSYDLALSLGSCDDTFAVVPLTQQSCVRRVFDGG